MSPDPFSRGWWGLAVNKITFAGDCHRWSPPLDQSDYIICHNYDLNIRSTSGSQVCLTVSMQCVPATKKLIVTPALLLPRIARRQILYPDTRNNLICADPMLRNAPNRGTYMYLRLSGCLFCSSAKVGLSANLQYTFLHKVIKYTKYLVQDVHVREK